MSESSDSHDTASAVEEDLQQSGDVDEAEAVSKFFSLCTGLTSGRQLRIAYIRARLWQGEPGFALLNSPIRLFALFNPMRLCASSGKFKDQSAVDFQTSFRSAFQI